MTRTTQGVGEDLIIIREYLREQLDWRGPGNRPQGIVTLPREMAEALATMIDNVDTILRTRP